MRNKLFAILFSLIFLFMFIGAPASLILTKHGLIEYNNVGNIIEADKTYDESTAMGRIFTDIENAKVKIKDVYINNLPFFLKITNSYKPLKSAVDSPVIDWLQSKGNENIILECPHVYNSEIIDPDCTNGGYTVKTCRLCSETVTENQVPALGHTMETASVVKPTCEADGYTLVSCTRCQAIEQKDVLEAIGHDYKEISSKKATCTDEGFIEYQCSVCQASLSVDTPITSHDFIEGKCTLCGEITSSQIKEEKPVIVEEGHKHSYEKTAVAPTCTVQGFDKLICSCGDFYEENRTPPTGHKFTSMVVAPTCTAEGYTKRICTICGIEQKTDLVNAKGHSYTMTTVSPTYTSEGYDLYRCACGDSYRKNPVPVLEDIIPAPSTTPDAEGTVYSASLKATDNIFRHYAITATEPSGESKTTYARIIKLDRDTLRENMISTSELINAMVKKDAGINWYLAYVPNIEATEIGTEILPQESTRHIYEEFLTLIDPSVKVSTIKIDSFNDYYNKFYITDHHWNHYGVEEGYMSILRMLRENYPDITPLEATEYVFEGVKFFGSLSRTHANYDVWDPFGIFYRDLDSRKVTIDSAISYGSKNNPSVNLKLYLSGEFNKAQGYYHYTEFFRVAEKITYTKNNTGRNLLLIGDSYSLPLLELVASHFDNTYVRYEDRSWSKYPEELYYEDFIKENNITDVMVIEEIARNVMQGYGSAVPSGFLNILPDEEW